MPTPPPKQTSTLEHLGFLAISSGVAAGAYWLLGSATLGAMPRIILTVVLCVSVAGASITVLVLAARIFSTSSIQRGLTRDIAFAVDDIADDSMAPPHEPITVQANSFRAVTITLEGTDISAAPDAGAYSERTRCGASWSQSRPDTIDVVLPVSLGVLGRELALQLPYRQLADLIHDADRVQSTIRTQVQ